MADFGIALAVSQAGGGRITETGLSMGTPHYMSPEQASGDREVDPRSDVFALGCVLYESLAGQPPFAAATAQAVLARILTGEAASVRDARPSVPTHVDAAVARALERIPADRFRSAADFADALAEPAFRHRTTESAAVAGTGGGTPWNRLAMALAFLVAVLAGAAAWGWLRPEVASEPAIATRAVVTGLGPGVLGRRLAISPDGRWIAATDLDQGVPRLKVRSARDPRWRVLPSTDGASDPTFSPDGTWIAYETLSNEIMRVPVQGGPPQSVVWGNNPHWAANDSIVFRIDPGGEVHMVGPAGGDPRVLLRNDTVDAFYPHLLPDGRGLLYSTRTDGDAGNGRVLVLNLASGEIREVARSGTAPTGSWTSPPARKESSSGPSTRSLGGTSSSSAGTGMRGTYSRGSPPTPGRPTPPSPRTAGGSPTCPTRAARPAST